MTRKSTVLGVLILAAIGVALVYSGWKMRSPAAAEFCEYSGRPVHSLTRTIGEVNGKRRVFCCLTCAFTEQTQTGNPVRILELADFETGAPMPPEQAYVVEDGNLNFCLRQPMVRDQSKQASPMGFDRCSPSVFAFARQEAAEMFLAEHGGRLMRFEEMAASHGH